MEEIQKLVKDKADIKDLRDRKTRGTYLAFMIFVYSFIIIIALVSLLNIVNSLAISSYSRIKEYGIMIAIGMDMRQVKKMLKLEAFSYGF